MYERMTWWVSLGRGSSWRMEKEERDEGNTRGGSTSCRAATTQMVATSHVPEGMRPGSHPPGCCARPHAIPEIDVGPRRGRGGWLHSRRTRHGSVRGAQLRRIGWDPSSHGSHRDPSHRSCECLGRTHGTRSRKRGRSSRSRAAGSCGPAGGREAAQMGEPRRGPRHCRGVDCTQVELDNTP